MVECVCHQIHTFNPNSQYDGIKMWGLQEVLGHESRALMNGLSVLMKETPEG